MRNAAREAARAAANAVIRDTGKLQSFHIVRFGRHRDGYYHAEVTIGTGNDQVYVHRRWGSWLVPESPSSHSAKELLSPFRDALAERAREFEEDERRARRKRKEQILRTSTDANDAARLLRLIGYDDKEIVEAIVTQFRVTEKKACGILLQVDNHLQQQEAHDGQVAAH